MTMEIMLSDIRMKS